MGAAVISEDLEGTISVDESDHAAAEGAAGVGAVGLAVGLFVPSMRQQWFTHVRHLVANLTRSSRAFSAVASHPGS